MLITQSFLNGASVPEHGPCPTLMIAVEKRFDFSQLLLRVGGGAWALQNIARVSVAAICMVIACALDGIYS